MNTKTKGMVSGFSRLIALLLMLVLLVSGLSITASAAENYQIAPNDSYTYWSGPGTNNPVSTAPMYQVKTVIDGSTLGISAFANPQSVFTDKEGKIYILDSDNGRIVIVNPDYKLNKVLTNLKYKGKPLDFTKATGLYVRQNGDIYIADTENARVIICDISGKVKGTLEKPGDDVIPDNFSYRPSKVAVDTEGFVYVLSEGSFYGAILYKPDGTFSGFFGSNTVKTNILGVFTKITDLIFRNDVRRSQREKSLPFQFTDIALDNANFVYTATGAFSTWISSTGQIRKLSPGGTNVLKNKTRSVVVSAESFNFTDGRGVKYENNGGNYSWRVPDMRSVDVDNYGYMYGLEKEFGHVFIYDQDCNLLGVFGGGLGQGTQKGTFVSPFAIHVNDINQDVLIVDKLGINVTIYKETEYGKLVKHAQDLTSKGAYVEAQKDWLQVLKYDHNNQLAYRGLAKASLISKDYNATLSYAKSGFDQDTYAQAFTYVRNDTMAHNFVWIFLAAIVVLGGLAALLYYTNKNKVVLVKNELVRVMFSSMTHPFESFQKIKYDKKGSMPLAFLLLFLYFFTTVISSIYSGFMYNIIDKGSYNASFVFLSTVGMVLLWVTVNWGMSTLFEGKGTAKQIFIVACYAMLPQIIDALCFTVFSNVMVPEEALLMSIIHTVCMVLTVVMICVGTMTIHEFGFGKFIGIALITGVGMTVLVFIIFMVGILIQQLISFLMTLYNEVRYR